MWGGFKYNFQLMLAGRIIFGIGCESMYVGQSSIVSSWFINYELPLAISMISCIPLCGSFLNGAIVPSVFLKTNSFGYAFGVGFILCLFSLFVVAIMTMIDKKTEEYDSKLLTRFIKEKRENERRIFEETRGDEDSDMQELNITKRFKQAEDIEETFKCSDIKDFEIPFWLTCLSCMCTYIAVINSIVIGSSVLTTRFNYTEVEAGFYFTLPYVISAICSPVLGWFVDKYGQRMTVTLSGAFLMIIAHLMQLSIPDCDRCWVSLGPLVLLGFSYTTYAVVLWGSLPYMVEGHTLGTAFGICTTF